MSYGRLLEWSLKLIGLQLLYTELATLAQDWAEWARLITANARNSTSPASSPPVF